MGKAYGIWGWGKTARPDLTSRLVHAACAQISILCAWLLLSMLMSNSKAATANVKDAISNVRNAVSVLERFGRCSCGQRRSRMRNPTEPGGRVVGHLHAFVDCYAIA